MNLINRIGRWAKPIPWWFGDEDEAVCVDLRWGRVIGHYQHDGYGKWDVSVCLSYWRAWWAIRTQSAGFHSMAAFPRCWVWFFRSKSRAGAEAAVNEYAPEFWLQIERDEPEELE